MRHSRRASITSEDSVFLRLRYCVPDTWLLRASCQQIYTDITLLLSISEDLTATVIESITLSERGDQPGWLHRRFHGTRLKRAKKFLDCRSSICLIEDLEKEKIYMV